MMFTLKVKSTRDYSKFKYINGNRSINRSHVRKLANSIKKKNLMLWQPIMIDSRGFVIDGQHRIEAAKMLDEELYYVTIPSWDFGHVHLLNDNVKSWNLKDFCLSYAKLGKKDYTILVDFSEEFGLPVSTSASLLSGKNIQDGGGNITLLIREGEFKIADEAAAREIATDLKEFEPYCEGRLWKTRGFIKALKVLRDKGIKQKDIIKSLKVHNQKITRQGDYRKYLFMLQDFYNYKKHRKIDLFA